MKKFFSLAVVIAVASMMIGCSSAKKGADMAAECAKTSKNTSEECQSCCKSAGYMGQKWMSSFVTGSEPTCECM